MRRLKLLVVYLAFIFVLVSALDDDFDEDFLDSLDDSSNDTITNDEDYTVIAARLNCSKLVILHKGIKVETTNSTSILKTVQRTAPRGQKRIKSEQVPPEPDNSLTHSDDNIFTLPPEIFGDLPENYTELPLTTFTDADYYVLPLDFPNNTAGFDFSQLNATSEFELPLNLATFSSEHDLNLDIINHQPELNSPTFNSQPELNIATFNSQPELNLATFNSQPEMNSSTFNSKPEMNLTTENEQGNYTGSAENATIATADRGFTTESSGLSNTKAENISETVLKEIHECSYAFDSNGSVVNWYQVFVENGGIPGEVNVTRLTPNKTRVLQPCHRPITNTTPPLEDLLYEYELFEFENLYRREKAFLRFAGTSSEFVDVVGQMVWAPFKGEKRYLRLSYRKDDTGFYVNVRRRHKCVFERNPPDVKCHLVEDFKPCEKETGTRTLSPGLQAALIG